MLVSEKAKDIQSKVSVASNPCGWGYSSLNRAPILALRAKMEHLQNILFGPLPPFARLAIAAAQIHQTCHSSIAQHSRRMRVGRGGRNGHAPRSIVLSGARDSRNAVSWLIAKTAPS